MTLGWGDSCLMLVLHWDGDEQVNGFFVDLRGGGMEEEASLAGAVTVVS